MLQRFARVSAHAASSSRSTSSLAASHFDTARQIQFSALSTWLQGEMRSNHAGETGAVWIYRGARAAMRLRHCPPHMHRFVAEHLATEEQHLALFDELLPQSALSKALPLWRGSGFILGFGPALLHPRAFFCTIEAVETFVEEHYMGQIQPLTQAGEHGDLVPLLQLCCQEEVHHAQEAAGLWRGGVGDRPALNPVLDSVAYAWAAVVSGGSRAAVWLAKRI